MRLLLDTHVVLWSVAGSSKLSAAGHKAIGEAEAVFVSAASVWEIAIKSALGKIDADVDLLIDALEASGFRELPVRAVHAARVAKLPLLHGDPFDRLLIAQALHEPLLLLTADAALTRYGPIVLAI